MPLESKVFIQGMNGDSEERFLEDAEYRYALNVRSGSSDNDNEGAIENVKGNTLVALSLPPGLNTCIGALEDKDERKVYYFLHNSVSNHSIAEYDAKNNVAEVLYISSELGFDLEYLITGANIIDDRILKWTDDYTEPKELDIIRIKNRSSNQNLSEDQYPNSGEVSDEQLISAIKYAPLAPPTAEYSNDYTIKYNNLFGKLFQFRYQYVYLNNEKSAWSPISKLEIPQGESFVHNKIWKNPQINNSIVVTVNGGSRLVKQVNFAVREGNLGDFYLAEELTKEERIQVGNGWDISWRFNNNTVNLPITRAESLKLYDDVPLLAKSQDLIDGNRLAYGNVVNGFDQVDTDVNVSPVFLGNSINNQLDVDSELGDSSGIWEYLNILYAWQASNAGSVKYTFNEPVQDGDIFIIYLSVEDKIKVPLPPLPAYQALVGSPIETNTSGVTLGSLLSGATADKVFQASYTAVAGDTISVVLNNLKTQIENYQGFINLAPDPIQYNPTIGQPFQYPANGYDPLVDVQVNPTAGTIEISLTSYYVPSDDVNEYFLGLGAYIKGHIFNSEFARHLRSDGDSSKTFKTGATHKFALAYSDRAGRLSTAMRKDNMTVNVPWYDDIPSGERGVVGMDIEINHQPPEWAEYYHVLYSKNTNIGRYLQAIIGIAWWDSDKDIWYINIDVSTIGFKETHPNSIVSYDWAKGDRLRIVKETIDDEDSYLSQYIDVEMADGLTDLPSTAPFTQGYPLGAVPSFFDQFESNPNDLEGYVVEIYSPLKDLEDGFYYEIGESYPIIDGLHQGSVLSDPSGQNQTSSQPAIVRLRNEGDVYWRFRWNVLSLGGVTIPGGYIEDPSFSDFYISNFTNQGRINLVDKNARRTRREATIYYSEKFIPETNINGLSSFFLESFNEYDKEKGSIQKLYSEDRTLLIFQELKVGMVMVNTAVFNDLSGQGLIGQSTNVLSDIQYYSGEYGISRVPESFAVYGNNKYFSDVNRGVVCRLGANGITPISDNKMHNYFNDTFNEISKNKTKPRVIGEYDKRFEEYIVSIRKEETYDVFRPNLSNGTVSFNIGEDAPDCLKEGEKITLVWDVSQNGNIIGQSTESAIVSSVTENLRTESGSVISFNQSDLPKLVGQVNNEDIDPVNIRLVCYRGETLAFSENILKWSTFYGYEPDYIIENGVDIISFKNGNLYTHNTNDIYNNFYGEQQDSRIEVISKENPRAIKFYKNIEEESTTPWDMIEGKNQVGQSTNLIKEDFETIESHHYAAFWKDINTPNIDNPLIEGEDMRSYTMSLLLRNDSVTLEKLFSIGIRYEVSELSGK
jgi:hypothetical protein